MDFDRQTKEFQHLIRRIEHLDQLTVNLTEKQLTLETGILYWNWMINRHPDPLVQRDYENRALDDLDMLMSVNAELEKTAKLKTEIAETMPQV